MLKGNKTYVTGTLTILTAIGAYLIGEASAAETIMASLLSLQGMFLRNGVAEVRKATVIEG